VVSLLSLVHPSGTYYHTPKSHCSLGIFSTTRRSHTSKNCKINRSPCVNVSTAPDNEYMSPAPSLGLDKLCSEFCLLFYSLMLQFSAHYSFNFTYYSFTMTIILFGNAYINNIIQLHQHLLYCNIADIF
jgi:hypothetical protein